MQLHSVAEKNLVREIQAPVREVRELARYRLKTNCAILKQDPGPYNYATILLLFVVKVKPV